MPIYDVGLERVSLSFATKHIFHNVTQGVFEGDRIGIVGRNGDGKSTLMKLLAGLQLPDTGKVTRRGGLTFGMLGQRDQLDDNATLREAALDNRQDYEWAAQGDTRDIVEALLGGMDLNARVGELSGGQRRRADLARLLLHDWDIIALDEPTNHLDMLTIAWLARHLRHRWAQGKGALLVVTHDRWFLDTVCESMWEVHDGEVEPFEGGYSAYMLQRVERDRQADIREERRRNLARKELAWLTRGARARATKQKFHVKQAQALIADVPPMRNALELKQMATSRLGKQVVDLLGVTQIYAHSKSDDVLADTSGTSDISAASAAVTASITSITSTLRLQSSESESDTVPALYPQPMVSGSVSVLRNDDAALENAAARSLTITGRKVLDDVTWLIGPGDRIGVVGENGAGKSTLLRILDGTQMPTAGTVHIGKTVKFAVLTQQLEALEELGKYTLREVLTRYKATYVVDGKEVSVGQLLERLGFSSAQMMTPIADFSGGQKRRIQLLLILLDEPNVLVLDEPGNDLDTDMLAVMEDLLDTWPGTLIVVSHDRYLLERVTDEQFAVIGGAVRHLPGGVDEYLQLMERIREALESGMSAEAVMASVVGAGAATHGKGNKNSRQAKSAANGKQTASVHMPDASANHDAVSETEQPAAPALSGKERHDASRRVAAIERKLAKLEQEKHALEASMAAHDPSDYEGLAKLNEQLKALEAQSNDLEAEWMALSEQLER